VFSMMCTVCGADPVAVCTSDVIDGVEVDYCRPNPNPNPNPNANVVSDVPASTSSSIRGAPSVMSQSPLLTVAPMGYGFALLPGFSSLSLPPVMPWLPLSDVGEDAEKSVVKCVLKRIRNDSEEQNYTDDGSDNR
jgi:hypothetical protein